MGERQPLSADRIVAAAVRVADAGGYTAVTMRNVGAELGVEAMSLYHHVANKDALLDALVEWVFSRIELPSAETAWREGMRTRAASLRDVLVRHPWALTLLDSRTNPGPALLRHHDAVIGCLRRGGFPIALAAQAFSVIDAYVYGFALTERNLPFDADTNDQAVDFAAGILPALGDFPHLVELVEHLTGPGAYSFSAQFADGLDIILDELARRLRGAPPHSTDAPIG